jgi:hypothetical protein
MEDGCSKRFDIGTLDLRSENYDGMHGNARQVGSGSLSLLLGSQPGGLPSMSMPPLGSNGMLTSTAPPLRSRDMGSGVDHGHGNTWGR